MSQIEPPEPKLNYYFKEDTLFFLEKLTLPAINFYSDIFQKEIKKFSGNALKINLSQLEKIDSAGVVFLNHIHNFLPRKNVKVFIEGVPKKIEKVIDTFSVKETLDEETLDKTSFLERVGRKSYDFQKNFISDYLYLMADLAFWTVAGLFNKKAQRKGEIINQSVLIGVNAFPLIALISFLIGLVLALQSAAQLRQFGANIFIVDLVVIAMAAEMGPLLTAVMIAGRSGSAIASEIASMKVAEELDALTTMGIRPIQYLVAPKMQASIITLPFLTMMSNIFGIFGGMMVAYFYLDISFASFYFRMTDALLLRDIMTGIIKSLVFAGIIVQTSAFFGLHVEGGAVGVGKYTTKAVVTSIFFVILADSALGLLFY